jgi:hypothetical protein
MLSIGVQMGRNSSFKNNFVEIKKEKFKTLAGFNLIYGLI